METLLSFVFGQFLCVSRRRHLFEHGRRTRTERKRPETGAARRSASRTSAASQSRRILHAPQGAFADMDLNGVVSLLESHWVVLEAELAEIHKDYAAMRAFTRKYGEYWNRSLATLKKMRMAKETQLKEYAPEMPLLLSCHTHREALPTVPRRIKFQMELFNLHTQQGRDLCYKLSQVASTIKTHPHQLAPQLSIEVVSPILANAQNPLAVPQRLSG
jgi:hypothetical protein